MGTAGDRLEERNIERAKKAYEKQKAQEAWEKSDTFTKLGYGTQAQYNWYQQQAPGSTFGERLVYAPHSKWKKTASAIYDKNPATAERLGFVARYWDGSQWVKELPTSIPMTEITGPAYNDTSKPGAGAIPDSSFQGGTTDISGEESFATTGSNSIADKFGIGDTGSPRRKRGRGMSAALGVM